MFYIKMIYYFKVHVFTSFYLIWQWCLKLEIGNLKISILPYMLTVFGIENLKISILYIKYGMNAFNLGNILFYMVMVLYKADYFIY